MYELYISRVESVRLTTPSLISSILTLLMIAVLSVCISMILLVWSILVVILFMIQSSVKNWVLMIRIKLEAISMFSIVMLFKVRVDPNAYMTDTLL